jgi:hypothetical protein
MRTLKVVLIETIALLHKDIDVICKVWFHIHLWNINIRSERCIQEGRKSRLFLYQLFFVLAPSENFETKEKLLTHFKYYFDVSFTKQQFAVTHRYTVLQDTE